MKIMKEVECLIRKTNKEELRIHTRFFQDKMVTTSSSNYKSKENEKGIPATRLAKRNVP